MPMPGALKHIVYFLSKAAYLKILQVSLYIYDCTWNITYLSGCTKN